ncbi:PKD domain-containing protein [Pleionea sediminis]|uniref:PKD domain-containing protein n=1 Tax=Pleionea sediminis TaxID=2569479 RepID=UPI001186DB97|nr:PKD domain-containing protein [Pleionea sediminis]
MSSLFLNLNKIWVVLLTVTILFGCKTEEPEEEQQELDIKQTIPFAFVERSLSSQSVALMQQFDETLTAEDQSPLDLHSPYDFFPGAQLKVRDGIEVDALEAEVLSEYFGFSNYDVKDLSVSPDGTQLAFAARGASTELSHSTWNIYIYSFEDKSIRRVIADDEMANAGQDTNPTFTDDGRILFSSDRDAGDPANPRENIELVGDLCEKVDPIENPSLLHRMDIDGQNLIQMTYGRTNHDLNPALLKDGRIAFVRWQRSTQPATQCEAASGDFSVDGALGLNLPNTWTEDNLCSLAKRTSNGLVFVTNHYQLLTIDAETKAMEQLYKTATMDTSEAAFLAIDNLLQAENGNLQVVVSHQFNSISGGGLLELQPQLSDQNNTLFGEFSPRALTNQEVDLYPGQYSSAGWYSAITPYQDGTGRSLVSWAQCQVIENGVNRFCRSTDTDANLDVKYGIWMFNPNDDSRLPVVRAKKDTVFSELALSQPKKSRDFMLNPFDPEFVDNPDATEIVCEFPNNIPVAEAGNDQSGLLNQLFELNGSNSFDPDGDTISYQWTLIEKPAASNATLLKATEVKAQLQSDIAGRYRVQLIVNDGKDSSIPDTATITVVDPNQAPVANAGNDLSVTLGSSVQLDGSASADPDGDALTYRWMILSTPEQSNVVLDDSSAVKPSFTPDRTGNYRLQLIVNDGKLDSAPDTVNVSVDTPPNQAPTANAGADQSGDVGQQFMLDGSASSDPEGASLTYRWSIQNKPANSAATLFNGNTVNPNITPDIEGNYVIQLIVNDGLVDSNVDSMTISVVKINEAPVANAGPDQSGMTQQTFMLNGEASADPDGDSLNYSWSLITKPDGSSASITNASSVNASITADIEGQYSVQLIVNDGELSSQPDTASISVIRPNEKPVANAGIDQNAQVSDVITLDGSRSSDPEGDPLTYSWVLTSTPSGSSIVLMNSDKVNPTLQPDVVGDYVAQLTVNDGELDSDPDSVTVSVSQINEAPIADAGSDVTTNTGVTVYLDGSASFDPEGEPLGYQWTLVGMPEGSSASLMNANTINPSIVADVSGVYTVELIVGDGESNSLPDQVRVTAENINTAPVANAGQDQTFVRNEAVQLDGSASSDPDGDELTYRWALVSPAEQDANIVINNANSVTPEVIISDSQVYRIKLVVNDGELDSQPDYVELSPQNSRPVANAGVDQSGQVGEEIRLDGSLSNDPDGDTLTYSWRIVSKPDNSDIQLSNTTIVNPNLVLDSAGQFVFELVVNDGSLNSEPDQTVVVVEQNLPPVANAGPDQEASEGSIVTLDGSASSDPDGDGLSFRWTIVSKPDSSSAQLMGANSMNPTIETDAGGNYVVQLIVNDGMLDSAADSMVIKTEENIRPVANAGENQTAFTGDLVNLDGTASFDPNDDAISYHWTVVSHPGNGAVTLLNERSAEPQFTPNAVGTYVLQLIVNDGELDSKPDTVSVEVEELQSCDASDSQRLIPVTIRDFTKHHPDFQYRVAIDYGIVESQLGEDGKPVYAHGDGSTQTTNGQYYFNMWYNDVPSENKTLQKELLVTRQEGSTIWEYQNSSFFPIDFEGYGNSGLTDPDHNYHFTLETHLSFDYQGGEEFTFRGDDDLWVFINGKLAIDIGGVHSVLERTINLDEIADELGITPGNRYTFDLFFAERHTVASNFMFQTNMELECQD